MNNYKSLMTFYGNFIFSQTKIIKKERSCIKENNLKVKLLNGNEIKKIHWDFFYQCYLNTTKKKMGLLHT